MSKCKVQLCNLFETGQCLLINTCVKFHSIPQSSTTSYYTLNTRALGLAVMEKIFKDFSYKSMQNR